MSFRELAFDWPAKRFWAQKARKAVWWFHWLFTLFKIKFAGNIFNVPISEQQIIIFPQVFFFYCLGLHRDFDMLLFLCVTFPKKEFFWKNKMSFQEVDNVSPVKTVLGSFSQIAPKEPLLVIHVFEKAPSYLPSLFQYFWKPINES